MHSDLSGRFVSGRFQVNGGRGVRRPTFSPTRTVSPTITATRSPVTSSNKIRPPAHLVKPVDTRTAPAATGVDPSYIPEGFRYSKEQLADMLARGQTETMERSGEDENGLPFADELEQKSREMDATKQFGVDASDALLPEMAPEPAGQGTGLLLAAVAAYFLLGG